MPLFWAYPESKLNLGVYFLLSAHVASAGAAARGGLRSGKGIKKKLFNLVLVGFMIA